MPVTWASDFLNDVASAVVTLKTMLTLDDGSAGIIGARILVEEFLIGKG